MKLFKTFFIGGYEPADLINNRGNRVDLLQATRHDSRIEEDYRLLSEAGIHTVREGIRWSVVDAVPYQYNWTEVRHRMDAAQKWGIQVCWDICHFGFPTDLVPQHPQFAQRFAAVCRAFAELYRLHTDDPLIVTPINEISFLSWLGGDCRGTVPFAINSGFDVKYHLCRAAIQGIEAIRSVDPNAQIMMVEPMICIHPRENDPDAAAVQAYNEAQFQAMDIITGRLNPELGGRPEYMNLAGFNYYYNNQWTHCGPTLCWKDADSGTPFSQLLAQAYQRYRTPVVLTETGHFKEDRPLWMEMITSECLAALQQGVDLRGICIYPVLDRPDWDTDEYITCGIWGYDAQGNRTVEEGYLQTVKACMARVDAYLAQHTVATRPPAAPGFDSAVAPAMVAG